MTLDTRLLEILACPVDKQGLLYFADDEVLYNPRLRRQYRIHEGIPVMLPDEAEEVDDATHEGLLAKAADEGISLTFGE